VTKIIGTANSCKECPNRHYFSGGTYECMKVQGSRLNADSSIPAWCPLADHPAATISALTTDAERYRWLRQQHWNEADMFVVTGSKSQVYLGTNCPSLTLLDEAIDAAKGAPRPEGGDSQ
jgi:hypothetical protein